MQIFRHEDIEADVLEDLLEEINELYEASEQILIELELAPADKELQRALFRSVHTIKGDLGLVNFSPMIPILQGVEDLLDYLRNSQITYTSTMSDLVLLTMDRVKIFVEGCIKQGQAEYDAELHQLLAKQISRITPQNIAEHEQLLAESVLLLDPSLDATPEHQPKSVKQQEKDALHVLDKHLSIEPQQQADIHFFRELMVPVEKRSKYWQGRCDRIAKLALFINRLADSPIDAKQLAVACYVHDFGMAFIPMDILHKIDPLNEQEFNLMRSHVFKSSKLLEHLNEWNEARKIVMQHHERLDGSGYPMGLKEKDICEGAKLLAIIDTFDALTHTRAHETHRIRPKKRAVIEINKVPEGQFCPKWMKFFNQTMSKLLSR
ncbi:HD domain-containing phosphohydrolase [Alteromonadaceae bacterium BrNp21-10]|nr:HD domain-containing phosphohydrolase [Alteromonadaceae bacterium BrNp21-10]